MKYALYTLVMVTFCWCSAGERIIADFEKKSTSGWHPYADNGKGILQFSDEALAGEMCMLVNIPAAKHYRGLTFHDAPPMPEGACGISFLIKSVDGTPPASIALSETPKRYHKRIYGARAPFKVHGDDWQVVRIHFKDFICDFHGPDYEKPSKPLKAGIYAVSFYVPLGGKPSVFLLDDIKWITK